MQYKERLDEGREDDHCKILKQMISYETQGNKREERITKREGETQHHKESQNIIDRKRGRTEKKMSNG